MISLGANFPDDAANQWRYQLDQFVKINQSELAALVWGLRQEWADTNNNLGIDLEPKPHFFSCSKDAIEKLNQQVDQKLQEILGILDGHNPETEVVIIAIAKGQVKLIYFQSEPSPPECFMKLDSGLDLLIENLEAKMQKIVNFK